MTLEIFSAWTKYLWELLSGIIRTWNTALVSIIKIAVCVLIDKIEVFTWVVAILGTINKQTLEGRIEKS